jgi:hypothetical protein
MVEYLDPEIAGEGQSANNWQPGQWADPVSYDGEEYQPEMEPPHINDYAMLKKHKHYKQYFRPYRYVPFPAVMYHKTLGEKVVNSREEVVALGEEWSTRPFTLKIDMTGKSLPVKTDTQRLTEALVAGLANKPGFDPASIATIIAATVTAMNQQQSPHSRTLAAEPAEDANERDQLVAMANEKGVKIDGRWSNKRIKEALGLE